MFSATTEYALRAVVFLGEVREGYHTSQTIASATHVPVQYLAKVLKILTEKGIVISQRGPCGGFALARSPDQITLRDVVDVLEPIERIHECPLGLTEHAEELCPLHKSMDGLAVTCINYLESLTIKDLVTQTVVPLGISLGNRGSS